MKFSVATSKTMPYTQEMPFRPTNRTSKSTPRKESRTRTPRAPRLSVRSSGPTRSTGSARSSVRSAAAPTGKPTRKVRHELTAKAAALAALSPKSIPVGEKPEYPMRINRYLAQKGYATRKAADGLIEKRRVFINNKRAVLGDKVDEGDVVEVKIDKKDVQQKLVYFAYNKPRSVITHSPQGEEREIREMVPELADEFGVFPVGRLDKDSHGLIILTNDGRITDRLLSPTREHEKEYVVQTKQKLRTSFKEHMETGVLIEGFMTKPTKITILGQNKFNIVLTEGKKHQIRRMVVAQFNEVSDLERTRVLNIELGKLGTGKYREIEGDEKGAFLRALGL
jgi:23S rRNA pseudouridine2604 synthase